MEDAAADMAADRRRTPTSPARPRALVDVERPGVDARSPSRCRSRRRRRAPPTCCSAAAGCAPLDWLAEGSLSFDVTTQAAAEPAPSDLSARRRSPTTVARRGVARAVGRRRGRRDVGHTAVASCKGGVGKSTTAVNLAYALAAAGERVGIVDLDIHGSSLPMMARPDGGLQLDGEVLLPLEAHGVAHVDGIHQPWRDAAARRQGDASGAAARRPHRVGRARLPDRRHAAGDGRRPADARAGLPRLRRCAGDDAAAPLVRRRRQGRRDVRQGRHPDGRCRREHGGPRAPRARRRSRRDRGDARPVGGGGGRRARAARATRASLWRESRAPPQGDVGDRGLLLAAASPRWPPAPTAACRSS